MASALDKFKDVLDPRSPHSLAGLLTGTSLVSKLTGPGSDLSGTKSADRQAEDALDNLRQAYSGIETPNITPEAYQDLGRYATEKVAMPEQLQYNLADPRLAQDTSFDKISVDPRLAGSQYSALDALDAIVKGGGMNAQEKADLARVQSEVAQADRGRREAILQNLGARGMSGSGMELLSQLQSNQAATDRASQSGLDIAGQAQQRALQAIMNQGNLAGSMQGQSFNQQAQRAAAQDAINKFNTDAANTFAIQQAQGAYNAGAGNRNAVMDARQFNANAANEAAKFGQTNAQNVANMNIEARNAVPQQNFQNQITLAQGKSGGEVPAMNYYTGVADRKAKERGNILGALVQGGMAAAGGV